MALPPLSAWNVQLVRLTSFVLFNDRTKEELWWRDTFGGEPETVTSKPKENLQQYEGAFEGGVLKLLVQPGRVDWFWSLGLEAIDLSSGKVPSLGNPEACWQTLMKAIVPWMKISPPAVRYAVGMVLDQQVADRKTAYGLLQAYLPAVKLSADTTSEFMYQINRPSESKVISGLKLNRLNKWMSLLAQLVEVGHGGQMTRKDLTVVRLELDINSLLVAAVPLPKEKEANLLEEMALEAFGVASKGDVEK
jgi:hypothetical protein